jgi:hypothetical protein
MSRCTSHLASSGPLGCSSATKRAGVLRDPGLYNAPKVAPSPLQAWPFALPRPDALSPLSIALPVRLCPRTPAHDTRRYEHPLAGGPGPIGVGLC